jgi:hypothetical protein
VIPTNVPGVFDTYDETPGDILPCLPGIASRLWYVLGTNHVQDHLSAANVKGTRMQRFLVLSLCVVLFATTAVMGCNSSDPLSSAEVQADQHAMANGSIAGGAPSSVTSGTISAGEREDLLLLHEEAKVARDVYRMMYQRWGARVFDSISKSKTTHMAAILTLLNRYGIGYTVGTNDVGVFANQQLQEVYNRLLARGSASLVEALRVGVTIEVTDIVDLEMALDRSDKRDIDRVYTNLLTASEKHLSAFSRLTRTN